MIAPSREVLQTYFFPRPNENFNLTPLRWQPLLVRYTTLLRFFSSLYRINIRQIRQKYILQGGAFENVYIYVYFVRFFFSESSHKRQSRGPKTSRRGLFFISTKRKIEHLSCPLAKIEFACINIISAYRKGMCYESLGTLRAEGSGTEWRTVLFNLDFSLFSLFCFSVWFSLYGKVADPLVRDYVSMCF